MFTGVNLTYFYRYLQEFSRVLKPGGYFVFDYFDIATDAGWNVLIENMARESPVYAYNYHSTETIDKIVSLLGFKIVDRYPTIRGSVFITAQSAESNRMATEMPLSNPSCRLEGFRRAAFEIAVAARGRDARLICRGT